MRTFLLYVAAFILAVLCTSLLGSVFSTQFVVAALGSIDVDVPLATRLSMTVRDFGILPTLLPAVAACFFFGFLVAGIASWKPGGNRVYWYVVAGATALVTELLIMQAVFGLMPIAGARTNAGLFSFALAGAAGGWVFARVTATKRKVETRDA